MPRVDSRQIRLLLSLGVVLGLGVTGTYAAWTNSAAVSGTAIQTTSVDLKVQDQDTVTGYTALSAAALEPGNSTAGVLTVKNSGVIPLVYYADASATTTSGPGLAGDLVTRVTNGAPTGSPPAVTCTGTVVPNTASSIGPSFVGSASARRTLASGGTESFCVELAWPGSASAELQGGGSTIGFTFRASTSPVSNWLDTVTVTGTALDSVFVDYLKTNATGPTASSATLPLQGSRPTLTTLHNYDTNRDASAGLLLARSTQGMNESDPTRIQAWQHTLTAATTLNGTATVRLWSAMKDFDAVKNGSVQVGLYDCNPPMNNCVQLGATTVTSSGGWSGGSSTWVAKDWNLGTVSRTVNAGRSLWIRVVVTAGSSDNMLFAYGTTDYPSTLTIK